MVWLWVMLILIVAACVGIPAMMRPCLSRKQLFTPFEHTLIAHRGFHNNDSEAPENTLAAFRKAVDAGYGIELDVQITADRQLVVFHDFDLKRMTGEDKRVRDLTYDELCRYTVAESGEHIPLFSDVLKLVDGIVPMIVEIKAIFPYREVSGLVAAMMEDYKGIYCIECFNPLSLAWYRKHKPEVLRGQLSMDYKKDPASVPRLVQFVLTHLLLNFAAKPDFISYNHHDKRKFGFRICRRLFHVKTAAWTIKSPKELEQARQSFDVFIFDSFDPKDQDVA